MHVIPWICICWFALVSTESHNHVQNTDMLYKIISRYICTYFRASAPFDLHLLVLFMFCGCILYNWHMRVPTPPFTRVNHFFWFFWVRCCGWMLSIWSRVFPTTGAHIHCVPSSLSYTFVGRGNTHTHTHTHSHTHTHTHTLIASLLSLLHLRG